MALVPFPGAAVPAPDFDPEPEEDDRTAKMSFLEHLDELRKRLISSVVALVGGFLICLFFIGPIKAFVMEPLVRVLPRGGTLIYTEPTEGFMLGMKMAALAGLFLAAPVILWQLWKFIAPGLYAHEKKFAIPFVVFATFFFTAGALFSHYIAFPWAWEFFASFSTEYMTFTPKVGSVFSLYVKMLLAFGVIFQMPTIVFFLARVGGHHRTFPHQEHQIRHPHHLHHRGNSEPRHRRRVPGDDGRADVGPLLDQHCDRLGVRTSQARLGL